MCYNVFVKIIAFDSGIERTGYAVFEEVGSEWKLRTYGCIETERKDNLITRIKSLRKQFELLLSTHPPAHVVMEQLFFTNNQKTGIVVAQSQGVLMSVASSYNVTVDFISPPSIKLAVTGYGKADKKQVEKMILLLLDIKEAPKLDDTVDAIACGYTYCTLLRSRQLYATL